MLSMIVSITQLSWNVHKVVIFINISYVKKFDKSVEFIEL